MAREAMPKASQGKTEGGQGAPWLGDALPAFVSKRFARPRSFR